MHPLNLYLCGKNKGCSCFKMEHPNKINKKNEKYREHFNCRKIKKIP